MCLEVHVHLSGKIMMSTISCEDIQVKEEPEEQISSLYVKTDEACLHQKRQIKHRRDAEAEEPHFHLEPEGHASHSLSYNDWEPFSCSHAQVETEPQNSGQTGNDLSNKYTHVPHTHCKKYIF